MLLDEAAGYFATLSPSVGTIQRGSLPAQPNAVVALREYSAAPSDLGFGFPGVRFEYAGLQVLVRGEPQDYDGPRAVIDQLYRAGAMVQAMTLGGSPGTKHFIWRPAQSPFLLERDASNRFVFAVNFVVQKELSAA